MKGKQESLKTRNFLAIVSPMYDGGKGRFPATMRLKKRSDYKRVYRCGVARKRTYFSFHIFQREGPARLGIVIQRRWGTAVKRNRMKRVIRETFRRNSELFTGMDIIVRPHEVCKGCEVEEVKRLLIQEFREAAGTEVESE